MANVSDDSYLFKLKTAKTPDAVIAKKLSISVEEVGRRWERIVADLKVSEHNGYNALCDQFTVMANQYQLLGASLKVMAGVIGSVMNSQELEELIPLADVENRKLVLENLRKHCIILRRFTPVSPEEVLHQVHAAN